MLNLFKENLIKLLHLHVCFVFSEICHITLYICMICDLLYCCLISVGTTDLGMFCVFFFSW